MLLTKAIFAFYFVISSTVSENNDTTLPPEVERKEEALLNLEEVVLTSDESDKIISKLDSLLKEVVGIKETVKLRDSLCVNLSSPDPAGESTFKPLLNDFYAWLKSSNTSSNKLNAAFLQIITEEHARLTEDIKRIRNLMTLEGHDENGRSLLVDLKMLSRNISVEKLNLMSEFTSFEENLAGTYRKIGCAGSTVNTVEGKFCRNGKWFYITGSYVGSSDDLFSKLFRLTRLRLYGQIWNLQSAGGNLAVFRLQKSDDLNAALRNLKEILEIAESVDMLVMLEVSTAIVDQLPTLLDGLKESPALFGVNIELKTDTTGSSAIFSEIANMRSKHELLLFSATFACTQQYARAKPCIKTCISSLDHCMVRGCSTGISYSTRVSSSASIRCDYNNLPRIKDVLASTFDFLIAKDHYPKPALEELENQTKLPILFLGVKIGETSWMNKTIGFLVDDEPIDKSDSLKTIEAIRNYVVTTNYERSTSV